MNWLELVENPESVSDLFEAAPPLSEVEIVSLAIERDGPSVVIQIAINESPRNLSPRLERTGANAVAMSLQLLAVKSLSISGWGTENRGSIEIRRNTPSTTEVSISAPTLHMSCECSWIRIAGFTPYKRRPPGETRTD